MQLGTRWAAGSAGPASLSTEIRDTVAAYEAAHGATISGLTWTLTWLEGRPRLELDDGTSVPVGAVEAPDSDDW